MTVEDERCPEWGSREDLRPKQDERCVVMKDELPVPGSSAEGQPVPHDGPMAQPSARAASPSGAQAIRAAIRELRGFVSQPLDHGGKES